MNSLEPHKVQLNLTKEIISISQINLKRMISLINKVSLIINKPNKISFPILYLIYKKTLSLNKAGNLSFLLFQPISIINQKENSNQLCNYLQFLISKLYPKNKKISFKTKLKNIKKVQTNFMSQELNHKLLLIKLIRT